MGGQVVADEIDAPGYSTAGFTNISTSDAIVHGQVKQAGLFSFVRIYESGHEVPFYQPLAALEMFSRALNQSDLATGTVQVGGVGGESTYVSVGTAKSTYREGNSTIVMEVLPANSTYDPALDGPDPTPTWAPQMGRMKRATGSGQVQERRKRRTGPLGRPLGQSKGGKREG